jgi:putative hydrolase of the HAD superfamily
MIKGVIFDFWGTLAFNDMGGKRHQDINKLIGNENVKTFDELRRKWWGINNVSDEEFFTILCEKCNLSIDLVPKLIEIWNIQNEHVYLYKNTKEVLQKLKDEGYKLGLISNTLPNTRKILTMHNLEKYFDTIILSPEVGLFKPNKKIYEIAIKNLNLKPYELLFIGDEYQADVLGPRSVGMYSFQINRKYHSDHNIQNLDGVFTLIDWIGKEKP